MADKVPVIAMVDPEVETIIKPFASELKEAGVNAGGGTTGSVTGTYQNGHVDGDGTID